MIISMEEEQKTVEYQETMKVDVENISPQKKTHGDQYEVIDTSFFEETYVFHRLFILMF